MKRISYNLFPVPFMLLGYIFIILPVIAVLGNMTAGQLSSFNSERIAVSATLLVIGLVLVSFRSGIIIPGDAGYLIKEASIMGITFSQEKIKIPGRSTRILICGKIKKATGYYRLVLPVTYFFKSFDMVFCGELGMTKILNTDYSRALKIAEFLKENLKIEYRFEPEIN